MRMLARAGAWSAVPVLATAPHTSPRSGTHCAAAARARNLQRSLEDAGALTWAWDELIKVCAWRCAAERTSRKRVLGGQGASRGRGGVLQRPGTRRSSRLQAHTVVRRLQDLQRQAVIRPSSARAAAQRAASEQPWPAGTQSSAADARLGQGAAATARDAVHFGNVRNAVPASVWDRIVNLSRHATKGPCVVGAAARTPVPSAIPIHAFLYA